ncbi:ABC transporter permease [Microvirga lotononidis]|uniref:ABC-type dipeptide/oligopeptide/nickel transport system, permease component n=1 Tax=Microvirga lotononidis TaxID=864069 RepID=I4Z165_9HYPH|nr:ABC transporter permease [Microvirga lotononidis]EIM29957.1 ABC-type dipeptide/oligopeptide/nickel transport system, permease component [Microvirga lotononidis]WQO31982.1 ABC transporter permease [Microvirga lotononidis]
MSAASSRIGTFIRALWRHKGAAAALAFLLFVSLMAVFADLLPFDPFRQRLVDALKGPSSTNWFGTDELGRDIFARVVYGARTSLTTAAGAVVIAATVGVPMGLVSGFFGGWRDATLMRLVDVMMTLPAILFAMALIAILGRSQVAAIIAVGITGIPSFARITRAQTLTLRSRDFVVAVEAFGGSARYNMFRTILPNSWSPILVQVVVLCSVAILLEAALAFLGVGVAPPTPSWGEMLRSGKSYLHEAPYYAVLPGLILTLTILSFDAIGRAMADLLGERYELRKAGSEGAA